jgi:hypothetical protein
MDNEKLPTDFTTQNCVKDRQKTKGTAMGSLLHCNKKQQ